MYKRKQSEYIRKRVEIDEIEFYDREFLKIETGKHLKAKDLEEIGVFDPNAYSKRELKTMV